MPVMSAVSIYNVTSLATEQIYGRNSRHGDDVESCGLNTALQCNVDGLPSLSPHSPLQNCPVRIRRNPPSKISQHKFINKCNANLCISCELTLSAYNLRNRRWGGCVYVLQMFFAFLIFLFFFRPSIIWQPFSGTAERIFVKLLPNDTGENGVCNVMPPPGEWRMLIICVIHAMTLAQSPQGATHGGCVII